MQRGQPFHFPPLAPVTINEEDYFRPIAKLRAEVDPAAREALRYLEAPSPVSSDMPVRAANALYRVVLELIAEGRGSGQLSRLKRALEVEYHMLDDEQCLAARIG